MDEGRRRPAAAASAGKGAGNSESADCAPRASPAPEADVRALAEATERKLGRGMALGVPGLALAGAVVAYLLAGLGPALLALAGGALLGTIAFFWASIRTLSGDAPVAEDLAAVAVRRITSPMGFAERKRTALRALKDIELEHAIGKIDDRDYADLSRTYREQAKAAMRELDVEIDPLRGRAEELARNYLAKRGLVGTPEAATTPSTSPGQAAEASVATSGALNGPVLSAREGFDTMRSRPPAAPGSSRVPCGRCAASNEPDAVFCKACGTSLRQRACASCGTTNELDAAFCKKCGTALSPPPKDDADESA
jgi:ribosomal protein L40E